MSRPFCSWTSRMASSPPRSGPPDIARAPIVAAVLADRPRLPKLPKSAGPYRRAWWRPRRDRVAMVSGRVLPTIAAVADGAPVILAIAPYAHKPADPLPPP